MHRHSLIVVDDLSFRHPAAKPDQPPAIRNISFRIEQGEYIAIVGANGSGKTTLARQLNALLLPTQGNVWVDGMNTRERKHHLRIHQMIGMVFQHPQEQLVATTIEEDTAFGPENLGLSTADIRGRVQKALELTGMWEQRSRSPRHLSAGQMQRVAVAGILAMHPSCIIFDEATAMLDPAGREDVLALMEDFHQEGVTILHITHFMEEAARARRLLALNAGELAFDGKPRDFFGNATDLQALKLSPPPALSIARQLSPWLKELQQPLDVDEFERQLSPRTEAVEFSCPALEHAPPGAFMIQADNLSFTYLEGTPLAQKALSDVSMTVEEQTIHGIIGATGSGKSTLLQHFNGLYLPRQGKLRVGAFDVGPQVDLIALRRFAGMVFQNPEYQLFEQYVGDEIAYGLRLLGFKSIELRQRVQAAMNQVGLDFNAYKDRLTFTLSGGERRKVALASTLALNAPLLLLDEPTSGLDPFSREETLRMIVGLNQQGKTILISSHQLEELALVCREVSLLSGGKHIRQESARSVFDDQAALAQFGMRVPVAAGMAQVLRQKGWRVPPGITTPQALLSCFQTQGGQHG